ncbi:poly-gamma-glutamate biosynthesis protein PgsC/CapC [Cognatilysobacter bugurensis]|uniref:Capsule biosynthesis CapC n=1 Tax=Cognatilysobacter bugurensis TaxID=543356 RepID=A0A918W965_9GAMM|nr:poly-gamma-glutamate biosynthesis protein PgsC/CapC [Lysobacter bugurensis]GHA80180.1 hypothetical protein GCM10007067_17340 [Lysobacter bugurensis]
MVLPLFPAQALDSSVITTVWVGLCVITVLNLRFGTTMAGLVVPGYLVPLLLIKPASAFVIWGEAIVTYLLARLVADVLMRRTGSSAMFGRDRFFALLLVSVFVRTVSDGWLLPALGQWLTAQGYVLDYHNNLYSFGLVIIALTANQMWNAGMARGAGTFVLYVGLTYVIVRGVLIPFTNFDVASLGFLYEGIASDILASPKAYLILLTTAFIASRMNLHYGWEFSGILIPALLALQWFQPTKLLISLFEAALIFGLGRVALQLPMFRRMNMEGSRLLLLFFTVGYLYKLALGYVLTWTAPSVKASDYFAFGYLLSTLLAVKMHQKQISWQITRTTVQTSLMGLVAASAVGYLLAIAWPGGGRAVDAAPAAALEAPSNAPLPTLLAQYKRALYRAEGAGAPLVYTQAELRGFGDGIRALLAYVRNPLPQRLDAARSALAAAGFSVVRSGDWIVVRDRDTARGSGLYAINLRPRTSLTVAAPMPLDEPGTFEAAVHLAHVRGHAAFLAAGTRRERLPEGRSHSLRNPDLPFARAHALASEAGVLHVRGLATPSGVERPSQLWVQRAVPPGLDLDGLTGLIGPLDTQFGRRPALNPLRDSTAAPFAELLLDRTARLRLIARTLGPADVRVIAEQQQVDGYLYAWLIERREAIAGAGSQRYVPPSLGDLLYLQSEVLDPLYALARDWTQRRDLDALRAVNSAAGTVGYRIVLHRHVGSGEEHLILSEVEGGRRQWGTYVLRLGEAAPYAVEIPRPLAERQTFEYGTRLFTRLDARALLISGAHFAVRPDGRGDVLDPANPRTVFNLAHQALIAAMGPDAWALQVRGRQERDVRTAPDVVASFVGKPAGTEQSVRVAQLVEALRGDSDTVALAGSGELARRRDTGADAQATFTRQLGGPRFVIVGVSAQARRAYRDPLLDDPDVARFDAVGIPTERVDIATLIDDAAFGPPPAPAVRALVDAYVQTQNIAALASARAQGIAMRRLLDPSTGRAYLRIDADGGRMTALRALEAGASGVRDARQPDERAAFVAVGGAWLQAGAAQ